jgi:HEAT repeat protein
MTTIRIIVAAAVACAVALPAGAQVRIPPAPPAPPAAPAPVWIPALPDLPDLPALPDVPWPPVDLSDLDIDLSHIDFAAIDEAAENGRRIAERFSPQRPFPVPAPQAPSAPPAPQAPPVYTGPFQGGSLYDQARGFIDRSQYERALDPLDRLIGARGDRADAAMYWKAYSLSKLARRTDALATIAELRKQYPKSPWMDDARSLEIEVKQASGQAVSPDALDDEEMKLLALRGVMQSDPETAIPVIEKMLAGNSSVRVKDRALFVVSQSRSPRARQIVTNVARTSTNPDLKRSAIRYLGRIAGPESVQALDDIYRGTTDVDIKRTILRSFMESRSRDKLLAAAKSEQSAELRGDAVQYLGSLRATAELEELYRTESNVEVKKRILQGMFSGQAADKLGPIARAERDPELQRAAIRYLGSSNRADAAETLVAIYNSDAPADTRRVAVDALAMHRNAAPLVALARAEKNAEMRTYIVRKLSTMRAPEAREYMLELLK